ncbi:hypothetical protein LSUE1_G001352 [Lachnellula suecica]|uniref:Uncharacterized protein n=1 Tax=Lachnellula suecica TaxID=602035 RepID=A0A8T9CFG6_9HELO|nr:hypothetical protein LSUE1_G001352 [Lachnellula suecica]
MKSLDVLFFLGAVLLLPVQAEIVHVSQRDAKGALPRELTTCYNIHGCRGSYVESLRRRDLAVQQIWGRASGEGAAGEGAAGEGADEGGAEGEGAQQGGAHGEGAQGQGAQGEGAQAGSPSDSLPENPGAPPSGPPTPPEDVFADSDGSLPSRPSSDIEVDDNPKSPENLEVLSMADYTANGQRYLDLMMQSIQRQPKQEPIYSSFNDRYRLTSDERSPLAPDPNDEGNSMQALLHVEPIVTPPEIGIDLSAEDWTFRMLTSKGKSPPADNKPDSDEDQATIVTYGSKSQKTIIVAKSNSVENDVDPQIPNPPKVLPNSELTFQLLQQQAGDAVSDTRLIIRHAINQKGTLAVMEDAHETKGLALTDLGTWTADDGDIFRRLLGNRNGRPSVFMLSDHPTAMKCKVVTRVFTWARIPGDPSGNGAMAMELGTSNAC